MSFPVMIENELGQHLSFEIRCRIVKIILSSTMLHEADKNINAVTECCGYGNISMV